jgi:hypothetical protein
LTLSQEFVAGVMLGNVNMMAPSRCNLYRPLFIFFSSFCYYSPQEEVDDVVMMSMDEILAAAESGQNFTADSISACKEYVRLKGCPQTTSERPPVIFR